MGVPEGALVSGWFRRLPGPLVEETGAAESTSGRLLFISDPCLNVPPACEAW